MEDHNEKSHDDTTNGSNGHSHVHHASIKAIAINSLSEYEDKEYYGENVKCCWKVTGKLYAEKTSYELEISTFSPRPLSLLSIAVQNRVSDVTIAHVKDAAAILVHPDGTQVPIGATPILIPSCTTDDLGDGRYPPNDHSIYFLKIEGSERRSTVLSIVSDRINHRRINEKSADGPSTDAKSDHDNTPPQPLSGGNQ